MVALSPWKSWPFKLEVHKNTCLALIIQIMWLKHVTFKKKSSRTLLLSNCYSSMQNYFKIDLILTMLFNVYFLYWESWTFWVTDKELLDNNKSIVSRFSVAFMQNVSIFVSECLYFCTSISWYFSKIDQIAFSQLEKIFSNDLALFL